MKTLKLKFLYELIFFLHYSNCMKCGQNLKAIPPKILKHKNVLENNKLIKATTICKDWIHSSPATMNVPNELQNSNICSTIHWDFNHERLTSLHYFNDE